MLSPENPPEIFPAENYKDTMDMDVLCTARALLNGEACIICLPTPQVTSASNMPVLRKGAPPKKTKTQQQQQQNKKNQNTLHYIFIVFHVFFSRPGITQRPSMPWPLMPLVLALVSLQKFPIRFYCESNVHNVRLLHTHRKSSMDKVIHPCGQRM